MNIFDKLFGKKPPVDAGWMGKAAMGAKPGLTMPDILSKPSGAPPMAPAMPMGAPPPQLAMPAMAAPETSGMGGLMNTMEPAKRLTKPGVFDRIGDFINSDEGRGALLRSGAATLQGGLGAGVAAGANWIDKRKADAAGQDRWDKTFGLQEKGVKIDQQTADTNTLTKAASIEQAAVNAGIDMAKLRAAIEKDRAGLKMDQAELASLNWYRRNQTELGYLEEGGRNNRSAADIAATNNRHGTVSASTQYATDAATDRYYDPVTFDSTSIQTEDDDGRKVTTTTKKPRNPNEGKTFVGPGGEKKVMRNGVLVKP